MILLSYNQTRKGIKYKEQAVSKKEVRQILPEEVKFKYKYNGKELQDELGLNVTAMDYRQYHSDIGRFMNIDALAPFVPSMTPYRFAYNNPIYWSDPFGLIEESVLMEMYNRSGNGTTLWKNDESLQGFTTEDGGFVGYTSNDTAYNQSPGDTTHLPGVTVKYKDDKDYSRAAFKIQQQVYNTKWYRDFIINEQGKIEYWDDIEVGNLNYLVFEIHRQKIQLNNPKAAIKFLEYQEKSFDMMSRNITYFVNGVAIPFGYYNTTIGSIIGVIATVESLRASDIARDFERLQKELGIQAIWVISQTEIHPGAFGKTGGNHTISFYFPYGKKIADIHYSW